MSARPERSGPAGADFAPAEVARYRLLFEQAPVACVITNGVGHVLDANEAAARLLEIPRHHLVGKPLQLFAEPAAQRQLRSFVRALASRPSRRADVRLRRRTGVPFDAAIDATVSQGEIHWTIQDISAQRLAEEQLWELNRALEEEVQRQAGELVTVLDELPIGVLTVDAATRTIRRANARAQETLGLGPGAAVDALDGVGPDGLPIPADERPSALALAGRRVEGRRVILPVDGGEPRELEVSAVPLRDVHGEITGAALTIDDVTALARRERAEREFVSNAAHQLRSPLTAITSAVAVLQRGEQLDDASRTRFLDHVEREAERMARLTSGLLTLARVERDGSSPRPAVVRVRELLTELAAEAARSGAEVVVDVAPDAAAIANEELLLEAVTNLVTNAVKHGGGQVSLRALRTDGEIVLEVADRGAGMPPDVLERVFDRFYRADGVRTAGFGLGLPIARAAARAAGGELTIESRAGEGTTARIQLTGATLL